MDVIQTETLLPGGAVASGDGAKLRSHAGQLVGDGNRFMAIM
jgi:hypothetical protein